MERLDYFIFCMLLYKAAVSRTKCPELEKKKTFNSPTFLRMQSKIVADAGLWLWKWVLFKGILFLVLSLAKKLVELCGVFKLLSSGSYKRNGKNISMIMYSLTRSRKKKELLTSCKEDGPVRVNNPLNHWRSCHCMRVHPQKTRSIQMVWYYTH